MLKVPFKVPKGHEVRAAVSKSYWDQSSKRVASAPYRAAIKEFLKAAGGP